MPIILGLAAALLLWVWLLLPGRGARARMKPFAGGRYAHRGLHGPAGPPENSIPAFRGAAERGYGIELDVHLTADGELVVFHDDDTARVCGAGGRVWEMTLPELQNLRLAGTGEGIPTFSQALEAAGDAPLIIEVKYQREYPALCLRLLEELEGRRAPWCVESFHPLVVRWFRKNRPEACRGILSMDFFREGKNRGNPAFWAAKHLLTNILCRPHFVAYDCRDRRRCAGFRLWRMLGGPAVAWTVRSPGEEAALARDYDAMIFEGYEPGARRQSAPDV